ncbi:hypothetical protein A2U01_0081239, partial [Trifolium medium]|nr:hypothetical protein [Trifolium medium]
MLHMDDYLAVPAPEESSLVERQAVALAKVESYAIVQFVSPKSLS